ncbi:MAG: universal stress protein [Candidatus Solibacter sp.]|jgi:nucleotide-binding universal stress UspA family protein|nr:universal stress protein [Candidatus Solibacter sp.]
MRILIAVASRDECADPVAAVTAVPWPPKTVFSVLSVSEIVPVPAVAEPVPAVVDLTESQELADAWARQTAASAAAELKEHGLEAHGTFRRGNPEKLIVEYANEWDADLIVIGSCEKTRIEKLILGSVSQSVVNHASCSVLVVKPHRSHTMTE